MVWYSVQFFSNFKPYSLSVPVNINNNIKYMYRYIRLTWEYDRSLIMMYSFYTCLEWACVYTIIKCFIMFNFFLCFCSMTHCQGQYYYLLGLFLIDYRKILGCFRFVTDWLQIYWVFIDSDDIGQPNIFCIQSVINVISVLFFNEQVKPFFTNRDDLRNPMYRIPKISSNLTHFILLKISSILNFILN